MECKLTPIELLIATKDEKLYNVEKKTWKWTGTMYWMVQCLNNNQSSVSDIKAPTYPSASYLPITENPTTWNFCNSKCNIQSQSLHVVFTFKPSSTDPKDFLQFVVNPYCKVTDKPLHYILDLEGKAVYFTLEMDKLNKKPYVELWMMFTTAEKGELVVPENKPVPLDKIDMGTKIPQDFWVFFATLVTILFIASIIFYIVRN